jgi:hypothetical protein
MSIARYLVSIASIFLLNTALLALLYCGKGTLAGFKFS